MVKEAHQILIVKYLSDSCCEAELREIKDLVQAPDFVAELKDAQRIKGLCAAANEEVCIWDDLQESLPEPVPLTLEKVKLATTPMTFTFAFKLVAAIYLFLVGGATFYVMNQQAPAAPLAFINAQNSDAELIRDNKTFSLDEIKELHQGDYIKTGKTGLVIVTYPDSSRIRLAANSNAQFLIKNNTKLINLKKGKVFGQITRQKNAMKITSHKADIEVLGTTFSFDSHKESSLLKVTEGSVKFLDKDSGEASIIKTQQYVSTRQKHTAQLHGDSRAPRFTSPIVNQYNRHNPVEVIVDISTAQKLYLL
ncbi:MAG: FecR domain-containing protein, partial [Lentisphaeraceae bacterium]|nr:FecR domain-containing protein [Lentisphaeraceae bacterium]